MESYAAYLKNYLKRKELSYSSAQKLCGVDRNILGRFANGKRLPKNDTAAAKIAEDLGMSLAEQRDILEIYRREKLCEEYQTDYHVLESVLNEDYQGLLPKPAVSAAEELADDGIAMETAYRLESREHLREATKRLFDRTACIKIKCDPFVAASEKTVKDPAESDAASAVERNLYYKLSREKVAEKRAAG